MPIIHPETAGTEPRATSLKKSDRQLANTSTALIISIIISFFSIRIKSIIKKRILKISALLSLLPIGALFAYLSQLALLSDKPLIIDYFFGERPSIKVRSYPFYRGSLSLNQDANGCWFDYTDTIKIENDSDESITIDNAMTIIPVLKNSQGVDSLVGEFSSMVVFEKTQDMHNFYSVTSTEHPYAYSKIRFPIEIVARSSILLSVEVSLQTASLKSIPRDGKENNIIVTNTCSLLNREESFYKEAFANSSAFDGQYYVRKFYIEDKEIEITEEDSGISYTGSELKY